MKRFIVFYIIFFILLSCSEHNERELVLICNYFDEYASFNNLLTDNDSCFILSGNDLIKLDENANLLWEKTFPEELYSILSFTDGKFLVLSNISIFEVNSNGDILNENQFSRVNFRHMIFNSDEELIVLGYNLSDIILYKINLKGKSNVDDGDNFTWNIDDLLYDNNYSIIWQNRFKNQMVVQVFIHLVL